MTHSLDPDDWTAFRRRAHDMLDALVDQMEDYEDGKVWNDPDELSDLIALTSTGIGKAETDTALKALLPYGVGNTHPRFFGWVHGAGTPSGLIADMVASTLNANCGGRKHAAIRVERAVIDWCLEAYGLPDTGSGLITTGTSMATLIALKTARDKASDFACSTTGMTEDLDLIGYASEGAHSCFDRAFDVLGLGKSRLRKLPMDTEGRMRPDALLNAIDEDRKAGRKPFVICATAGTVNRAAIDDLSAIGTIAHEHDIWFHVDAAFAAALQFSARHKQKLSGLSLAQSIGFDFHKWMQVNYDAGCVLIRDRDDQIRAFSDRPDYLADAGRGLGSDLPWPVDLGPELSRGFRALKVWAQLLEYGPERLGQIVDANIEQAEYLARLVDGHSDLERLNYSGLNICCFRYVSTSLSESELDALNQEIVIRLQESGVAAPSTTRIDGKLAIRVNITNHRTQLQDMDILIEAIALIAEDI